MKRRKKKKKTYSLSDISLGLLEASSHRANRPSTIATLRLRPAPRSAAVFARRNNRTTAITSKRKKERLRRDVIKEAEDTDGGDPFEALFGMLEEDLKNLDEALLGIDDDDDEDISPEELAKLEKELEFAIGESGGLMQLLSMGVDDEDDNRDVIDIELGGESEDDEDDDEAIELKDWQLKKLAAAAKAGRRKTNIRSLAAELGLDRDLVLDLLRIPPEDLLSMSADASSENQKSPVVLEAEYEVLEDVPNEASNMEAKAEVAVEATQTRKSSPKNGKKVPR
uniref:Uncharacterized protein n=1 Tax=Kalanchoe fedtschenkoi TaxID=63787 RepID=A0A7N0SVG6_KALFE